MSRPDHGEIAREVRRIAALTSRRVTDAMAGQYHSVFKGRGMDFDEVRPYQEGDDVRTIDWNVSARMNEPYVKVYVEERELTVMLLVDMSASMPFGTRQRTKRQLAATVAAIFGFLAVRNNDRVGVILFTDRVEKFITPKKSRNHVLRAIWEVLDFEPTHAGTDVAHAFEFLARVSKRQAVAVVVSDFLDEGWEQAMRIANSRHDLVPVMVEDPLELALPDLGLVALEDMESGDVVWVDTTSERVRASYRQARARAREVRDRAFRRLRVDFKTLETSIVRPSEGIAGLLKRRASRLFR